MNPEKRLNMLDQMITKGSEDPFVWYARAIELRSLEQHQECYKALKQVAEKFPTYLPTFLIAGQTAELLEKHDEAKHWFQRGIQIAKESHDTHAEQELEHALSLLMDD